MNSKNSFIKKDDFLLNFEKDLLKYGYVSRILDLIKPYKRIKIKYIAQSLGIPDQDALNYFIELINDDTLKGFIDHVDLIFEKKILKKSNEIEKLNKWLELIKTL